MAPIDPELWRDIHNNVRKMDDLYDATFYTWLKSEDNVLVTASYLQRLAGEYDHDRIEHALCWLVHGWRLESIAVLVKQVTFDWIHVHGEQGEKNRARLVLALTDNWAIQYIARLAGTLLTSAATPSPPPTILTFTPCHSRMASLPGSPTAPPSLTSAAATWGSPSPQSSVRPSTTFSQTLSTPSSPRSSHQPLSTFNTPQPIHGRRMAVSRRHGSPMAMPSAEEVAVAAGRPASMSPAAESHANSGYRSSHHRQSSSTLPGHQQHQAHHQLLQQRTSSSSLSSDHTHQGIPPLHPSASTVVSPTSSTTTASDALSIAAAAPVYPSPSHQQSASYHPHHCNVSHHPHHHQHHPPPQPHVLSPQLQHHRQTLHRAPVHIARTTHGPHATHVRQSSQPGNISTSKQHWLQQQSSYAASPIFYMNKSLFMEELSRKWSFCRLSEFFQCLDPASGIHHKFKCKLLKESGLKDELSQKQKLSAGAASATATGTGITGKDAPDDAAAATIGQVTRTGLETDSKATAASMSVVLMDETTSEGSTPGAADSAMDVVMADSTTSSTTTTTPSALGPSSVVALLSAAGSSLSQPTPSTLKDSHAQPGNATMHPLDTPMETVTVTCGISSPTSSRSPSVSAPIPLVLLQQEQTSASAAAYRPLQSFGHGQQQQNKDDMRSGLNSRGFRNANGNHQHSRAQTVEAIMSKTPATSTAGPSGLTLAPTSSTMSSNSTVSSPMPSPTTSSTMAASASLSNLSLTEQPSMEPTSRPLSQQHNLSPYTTHFSGQSLYRHGVPPHSVPTGSSSAISSSSSTTATSTVTTMSSSSGGLLTIHSNGQQQQQQQGQTQQSLQQPQQPQRHHPHDSTSAKRKNSLGVSLVNSSNCTTFSSNGSSSVNMHSSSDGSLSSSSAIFPGPRRTSTSASTTNEDLKRLRCSRQNSTSSTSGI